MMSDAVMLFLSQTLIGKIHQEYASAQSQYSPDLPWGWMGILASATIYGIFFYSYTTQPVRPRYSSQRSKRRTSAIMPRRVRENVQREVRSPHSITFWPNPFKFFITTLYNDFVLSPDKWFLYGYCLMFVLDTGLTIQIIRNPDWSQGNIKALLENGSNASLMIAIITSFFWHSQSKQ